MKSLGQIGYEAYGEKAGAHGPWKTFDGRPMPKWEELSGEAGELTKTRWEEAAREIAAVQEVRGPLPLRAILPNPTSA